MFKRLLYLLFILSLLIEGCSSDIKETKGDNISRIPVEEDSIERKSSFDDYDDYDIKNDERRHYRREYE